MANTDDTTLVNLNTEQVNKLNNLLTRQTEVIQQVNKVLTLQRTDADNISALQEDMNQLQTTVTEGFETIENEVTDTTDKTITYLGNTYSYNEDDNLYYHFEKTPEGEVDDGVADVEENNVEVRYVSILPLSPSNWIDYTLDVATYEGIRYDPNDLITTRFFRETLQINSFLDDGTEVGTIRASSMYIDAGEGTTTTVDTAYFPVECADGKYSDVKIIKIIYDNNTYADRNVRTLQMLK